MKYFLLGLALATGCGGSAKGDGGWDPDAGTAGSASGGAGGGAGSGNRFVTQLRQGEVNKVDLLFMIDISVSMSGKQGILKNAVPLLLRRFSESDCISLTDPDLRKRPVDGLC